MKRILLIPFPGLCYFRLLKEKLSERGYQVTTSWYFPRRGIIFGTKYDVIHVHMVDLLFLQRSLNEAVTQAAYFFFVVAPFSFLRGIKIVWTCHEWYPHELTGIKRFVSIAISGILLLISAEVVVHSNANLSLLRKKFAGLFGYKARYISHGTLAPFYRQYEKQLGCAAFKPLLLRAQVSIAPTFVSLGFMRFNKGTDIILQAFCDFIWPEARLLVIGNCNDEAYYRDLVKLSSSDPRISLQRRNVSDIELINLHLASDAVIFAFRDCPTSGSLITALSLGAFVVAPATGHCLELVSVSDGILFDSSSSPNSITTIFNEFVKKRAFGPSLSAPIDLSWAELPENQWPHIIKQYDAVYG